jgi:hypothetical protein
MGRHAWFIVPDGMLAPRFATDKHGPLAFLGEFDQRELTRRETARVLANFDAHSFAEVPAKLAKRLAHSIGVLAPELQLATKRLRLE